MKRELIKILFISVLIVPSAASSAEALQLITVEDGDTLIVQVGNKQARIQLMGIDAPEDIPNPKYAKDIERTKLEPNRLLAIGKAATNKLVAILNYRREIKIDGILGDKDKYGRIPALVLTHDGQSINKQMVSTGYAVASKYAATNEVLKTELLTLQAKAQESNSGLWSVDKEAMTKWSGIQP